MKDQFTQITKNTQDYKQCSHISKHVKRCYCLRERPRSQTIQSGRQQILCAGSYYTHTPTYNYPGTSYGPQIASELQQCHLFQMCCQAHTCVLSSPYMCDALGYEGHARVWLSTWTYMCGLLVTSHILACLCKHNLIAATKIMLIIQTRAAECAFSKHRGQYTDVKAKFWVTV